MSADSLPMLRHVSALIAAVSVRAISEGSAPEIVREYYELLERSEESAKIPCVALMMFQGSGACSGSSLRPRMVLCMCDKEKFFGGEDGSIVCETIEGGGGERYNVCMEIPMEIYRTFVGGNKLGRSGEMNCNCCPESISTPLYRSAPWFVLSQSQTATLFSLLSDMGEGWTYTSTRVFSREDARADL